MRWSLIADEQQTLDKAKEQQEHRCFFDFSHLVLPAQAGDVVTGVCGDCQLHGGR